MFKLWWTDTHRSTFIRIWSVLCRPPARFDLVAEYNKSVERHVSRYDQLSAESHLSLTGLFLNPRVSRPFFRVCDRFTVPFIMDSSTDPHYVPIGGLTVHIHNPNIRLLFRDARDSSNLKCVHCETLPSPSTLPFNTPLQPFTARGKCRGSRRGTLKNHVLASYCTRYTPFIRLYCRMCTYVPLCAPVIRVYTPYTHL